MSWTPDPPPRISTPRELWQDTAQWTVDREAQQDRCNDSPPPPDPPDAREL